MKNEQHIVFVSYAREDVDAARRLYETLKVYGVRPWMDESELLPGQHFAHAIKEAIRTSKYFIALLSVRSVGKRGFVQRELREALDVLAEVPRGEIYLIPARLDACTPRDRELTEINWVDLFPVWDVGVAKILRAMGIAKDSRSYIDMSLELHQLLAGEREAGLRDIGGVGEHVTRLIADSIDPVGARAAFDLALREIVHSWHPDKHTHSDPNGIYYDRLVLELIAEYRPSEGFVKILDHLNKISSLSTNYSQIEDRALSTLESYYPVPPPHSRGDSAFGAYCDFLLRQLDHPVRNSHAFRRLLELGVLNVEDARVAELVKMPGVVQEFLQYALGEHRQVLQRMIGTIFAYCLATRSKSINDDSKTAYMELRATLDRLGAQLAHADHSPVLKLATGEQIDLLLPASYFGHYITLMYDEMFLEGQSQLARFAAEGDEWNEEI